MARTPRLCPPFTFQHIIFRFLDRRYRFVDEVDRRTYLLLLGEDAIETSWRFVSYSLMSNHGHFGTLTGAESLQQVFQRPHSRFAHRWHRRHGGLGPVFADRPTNHCVRAPRVAELIAYNHMDPVRNGLVTEPAHSEWTSHRAYLRLAPGPSWLDVEFGLHLCGFDDCESDRRRFDDFVRSCERRHWQWDAADIYMCDGAVDVCPSSAAPALESVERPLCTRIIAHVAHALQLPPSIVPQRSRRPADDVARARRIAAAVAVAHFGHARSEVAEAFGVTRQAVDRMLKRDDDYPLAADIAAEIARNS